MSDLTMAVATAPRRDSRHWEQGTVTWGEFIEWVKSPGSVKEAGNYVLGTLRETTVRHPGSDEDCTELHRNAAAVVARDGITIDVDHPKPRLPERVMRAAAARGWLVVVHPTFSATEEDPRHRVVLPIKGETLPSDYVRAVHAVTAALGIDWATEVDPGSDQPERYMFRPATQDEGMYRDHTVIVTDGEPVDVVELLGEFPDAGRAEAERREATDAGDPFTKPGLIGAFNRVYDDLDVAIAKFGLPYVPDGDTRWRLMGTHGAPGMSEISDGRWFSHHSGDPASAHALTMWDLVRIHLYGAQDAKAHKNTSLRNMPSQVAMVRLAVNDAAVMSDCARAEFPDEFVSEVDDAGKTVIRRVRDQADVTNAADSQDWLFSNIGQGALSGVFRRPDGLVFTPTINEDGYQATSDKVKDGERDDDGPAQVRAFRSGTALASRIDTRFFVFRQDRNDATGVMEQKHALFPTEVAGRVLESPDECRRARELRGVTHAPLVRADGTVLDAPGYDDVTGLLYLPIVDVPGVAEHPTPEQVTSAWKLLLLGLDGFPFESPRDKANAVALLLTPSVRLLVPPTYRLSCIEAPRRGSGKTLLAKFVKAVHGGVFRVEFPEDDAELRKQITSILVNTTAPVVIHDNVSGELKSSHYAGLMTSRVWTDRVLGSTAEVDLRNDRVWVVTGNNLRILGDLGRRTNRIRINPKMDEPERRAKSSFAVPDLLAWAEENHGALLHAILTVVRGWVAAGSLLGEADVSDDYGQWEAVMRGIVATCPDGYGVGAPGKDVGEYKDEDEEPATFFAALRRVFGPRSFMARDIAEKVALASDFDPDERIGIDELPGDLAHAWTKAPIDFSRAVGNWLRSQKDKRLGEFTLAMAKKPTNNTPARWGVWNEDESDLL